MAYNNRRKRNGAPRNVKTQGGTMCSAPYLAGLWDAVKGRKKMKSLRSKKYASDYRAGWSRGKSIKNDPAKQRDYLRVRSS